MKHPLKGEIRYSIGVSNSCLMTAQKLSFVDFAKHTHGQTCKINIHRSSRALPSNYDETNIMALLPVAYTTIKLSWKSYHNLS